MESIVLARRLVLHLHFVAAAQINAAVAAARAVVFDMQFEVAEFARGANIGARFQILKLAVLGDPMVRGGIVGHPTR